jgi:acyl-CoA synthetase (AMP-forming)/AMP-acid ligase II
VDATGEPVFCEIAETLGLKFIYMSFSADAEVPQPSTGPFRPAGRRTADVDDIALILQTSGTTSKPKLVPLSHANVLAAAEAIGYAYRLSGSDVCLNPMPHHHVHGLISAGLSSLVAGSAQYCASSFAPAAIEAALEALQPTWFTGVPPRSARSLQIQEDDAKYGAVAFHTLVVRAVSGLGHWSL